MADSDNDIEGNLPKPPNPALKKLYRLGGRSRCICCNTLNLLVVGHHGLRFVARYIFSAIIHFDGHYFYHAKEAI